MLTLTKQMGEPSTYFCAGDLQACCSEYSLYETMFLIHEVECKLLALFAEGLLRGTVHTCLGQEAIAAGVIGALDKSIDIICSNHRGHGHFLAYSGDVKGLIAECMGHPEGVCGGIGGSQHLHKANFYSNGILGGMVGIATGMAMAEKIKGSGSVVVVFTGDGGLGEGIIYEAFNMASLWQLPILFAVEHNGYAQSTPTHLEHAGELSRRAEPFGIPATVIDGNDVLMVHRAAHEACQAIRRGDGPRLLFMNTYRLGPHSKGDDLRDPNEISNHAQRAPLVRAHAFLDRIWRESAELRIRAQVATIIDGLKETFYNPSLGLRSIS